MTYPRYNFNDPNLDYSDVNDTVNEMFSDLLHQHGCCGSKKVKDVLDQSVVLMQAISIDEGTNQERYEDDVKSAYLLLYSVV